MKDLKKKTAYVRASVHAPGAPLLFLVTQYIFPEVLNLALYGTEKSPNLILQVIIIGIDKILI